MNNKLIVIAVVFGLLLIGIASANAPEALTGMNQLEVVQYLIAEHDAGRDTAYGNYQLMVYTDAFTSKGFKQNTISGDYQELRIWLAKHKNDIKISRNNMVQVNN